MPRLAWGTQTFIAGLSAGAVIAPWVIKGAIDGAGFVTYVEKVLELERESDLMCKNNLAHASSRKEYGDIDDFKGTTGRAT